MAEHFEQLEEKQIEFIGKQKIFFVSTAPSEGRINLSPKGSDSFRVLNEQQVVWLNLTGSGNETAAHIIEDSRMTIMFCSFDKQPLILRLYGQAKVIHQRDSDWSQYAELFPTNNGARQFFLMDIDLVQTSCGFAVPLAEGFRHRTTLDNWAEKVGPDGIQDYWLKKNTLSLDNRDTGIFADQNNDD